jgi:hypothetical protein
MLQANGVAHLIQQLPRLPLDFCLYISNRGVHIYILGYERVTSAKFMKENPKVMGRKFLPNTCSANNKGTAIETYSISP